jgi:hypothetical protein
LARAYRRARRHLASGGATKSLHARTIALVRFATARMTLWNHSSGVRFTSQDWTRPHYRLPARRSLMEQWNREHGQWGYEDVRLFNRDLLAALRHVCFP